METLRRRGVEDGGVDLRMLATGAWAMDGGGGISGSILTSLPMRMEGTSLETSPSSVR